MSDLVRLHLTTFPVSLELQAGWDVHHAVGNVVVCCPEQFVGRPRDEIPGGLALITKRGVTDLSQWSTEVMSHHVRQGHPEWQNTIVAGVPGRVADWTDGVADVLTAFLVRDGAGLQVEVSRPAFRPPGWTLRDTFDAVLASLRWHVSGAPTP